MVVKVRWPTAFVGPRPLTVLCLHWASDGPTRAKGAYLSASFPAIHGIAAQDGVAVFEASDNEVAGDLATGTITRVLQITHGDTADFSLQSDPHPSASTEQSWTWTTQDSPQLIQVAAINTSDTQRENNNAFYSGILFGIAGAALVALITELVRPFGRRSGAD
jgi:hypothetical protein